MSALSALYVVLPLPMLFLVHSLEELAVCTLVGAVFFGANLFLAQKAAVKIGGLISPR